MTAKQRQCNCYEKRFIKTKACEAGTKHVDKSCFTLQTKWGRSEMEVKMPSEAH